MDSLSDRTLLGERYQGGGQRNKRNHTNGNASHDLSPILNNIL
ncbi:hypothetical protein ACPOL_4588 [Acidisarcina polymorpha]|uniref:Uncharacterized protein n=1 Tax=Acidisarcina polymorpha TaxID=2211140 RepID=A0A2Z5G4G7_9BACT|nr:hypothetical protein ACPOL_4588 [Acidisarcina polymorpha]